MMRTLVASVAFTIGAAGCTLLVSFDEVPTSDAGFTSLDARAGQRDVSVVDMGTPDFDGGATLEDSAPPPDASVDYSTACTGKVDGKYCNGNQVFVDGGSKDDLVTCLSGKTVSAKLCANGCQRMPSGYPDECDPCQGKAAGTYCGDDFVGWHPMNRNTRIRCDNGAIVGNVICSNGCSGTGPNASCQ